MENPIPLRLMKDRRYQLLPVDSIEVLNSRDREQGRFGENVRSIQEVGLLKPVLVNERFHRESGRYELVCGEGRLLAHKRLGRKEITAEIIDCDRKQAYLLSLIENIARVPPGTMWFAREVKRMHDAGMTCAQIGRIVGKCESYVAEYLTLVERGEERLIRGVEQNFFPVSFAVAVAACEEGKIQNLLMDAFDSGLVSSSNVQVVRKLLERRMNRAGFGRSSPAASDGKQGGISTVKDLRRVIVHACREAESFNREARSKEGRLVCLVEGLKVLRSEEAFVRLVDAEGMGKVPQLDGLYKV